MCSGPKPSKSQTRTDRAGSPGAAPLLLSVDGVAITLSVSRRTVWRLVSTGELPPALKIPGVRGARWRRADIVRFVVDLCVDEHIGNGN